MGIITDDFPFSEEFLKRYEPESMLARTGECQTWLCREISGGERCICKIYSEAPKVEFLSKLSHPGLPRFIEEFTDGEYSCVVREYAPGLTLAEFLPDNAITQNSAVEISIKLAEILYYLHSQNPPVIHRDIKPANVILDGNKVRLIDFGIARFFDEKKAADTDTVLFGSSGFAAPEQLGYGQSDARTDIFSFGQLLRLMLARCAETPDNRLLKLADRCTKLEPDKRYRSFEQILKTLKTGSRKNIVKIARIAVAGALVIGFAIGLAAGIFSSKEPAVKFMEPLLEASARLALGFERTEKLTALDLTRIREIYLWDEYPAANREAFDKINPGIIPANSGGVQTLDDLRKMPNLEKLYISEQDFKDIAALESLTQIRELFFANCGFNELPDLSGLPNLTMIQIWNDNMPEAEFDISPLAACEALDVLNLHNLNVRDYSPLLECKKLKHLFLTEA
ncbi:MAG: protein kinase, partial [Oscillospiraceae bacterium]|nr:protein kinase [Oscillospiraceae bacterium]